MLIALDFSAVLASWPLLVRGVVWTIGLTIVGTVLGLLLGTACAWARARNLGHRPTALRWAVASYVELVRNTPFIVQLFFLFFGLPALGLKLSPEFASVLAMADGFAQSTGKPALARLLDGGVHFARGDRLGRRGLVDRRRRLRDDRRDRR